MQRDRGESRRAFPALNPTLPETNMETQKGAYKDYSPFNLGAIWVSMLDRVKGLGRPRLQLQILYHSSGSFKILPWGVLGIYFTSGCPTPNSISIDSPQSEEIVSIVLISLKLIKINSSLRVIPASFFASCRGPERASPTLSLES